jgi:uncharacterized membrane protein YuzA (DUF378 family)
MKSLKPIASVLVVVGAINWGLVGLGWLLGNNGGNWNIVHALLAGSMQLEAIVYVLVGAAGVWALLDWKKMMN